MAGVDNPEILLARERVVEEIALRQLAAAQALPSLNAGLNVDLHQGVLQQSTGNILKVNRGAMYMGLGANAVAAGTVNIPGLVYNLNVGEALFTYLRQRLAVQERQYTSEAVRNDILLRVARTYLDLLRAEGRRSIAMKNREEAYEVARLTANYARTGQGRKADADRAATELFRRNAEITQAENDILVASARLGQLLSLGQPVRLQPMDGWVVPSPLVPDPIPLPELIAIALTQRPELKERRTAVQIALTELRGARLLPFSPSIILGYSTGTFGGGSNLVANGIRQPDGTILQASRFGRFDDRQDVDVVAYWTLRNLGIGNVALIRAAQSRTRASNLRLVETLDRVRAEVAEAYARTHARYALIKSAEEAVTASSDAFAEDLRRIKGREGLPIEVIDSVRLLSQSRYEYLDAIVDYNRAHFELYVALGQPPADKLARPVPISPDMLPGETPAAKAGGKDGKKR